MKQAIKEVFSQKQYLVIGLVAMLLMYIANPIIYNFKLIKVNFSSLVPLILGFHTVPAPAALFFIVTSAILAGIIIAMSIFLVRRQIKAGLVGGSGVLIGLLAPACPSCAVGLLTVFGIGGFLAILPFKGLEIGVLGVIVLLYSIFYLSKKIETKVCKIKL